MYRKDFESSLWNRVFDCVFGLIGEIPTSLIGWRLISLTIFDSCRKLADVFQYSS